MLSTSTRGIGLSGAIGLVLLSGALAGCPRPAQGFGGTGGASGTGGSGGVTETTTTGGGGQGTTCEPDSVLECPYSGPDGTEGVGTCKAGQRTCKSDGSGYTECTGQVLPVVEVCKTPEDENCGGDTPDCGALAWLKGAGDAANQIAGAVAFDAAGRAMVVGQMGGKLNFGQLLQADGVDAFLVTFDVTGQHVFSKLFSATDEQVATSVIAGGGGGATIGGYFKKSVQLGDAPLVAVGGRDGFFFQTDADGNVLSAKQISGPADEVVRALAPDGQGGLIVGGEMTGPACFEQTTLPFTDGTDSFVARYDSAGALAWAIPISGVGEQEATSIALAPDGAVIVAGRYTGTLECGGMASAPSAGDLDVFVAKLDGASGAASWVKAFPSPGAQQATSVAVGLDGTIVVTGSFTGSVNFGPNASTLLAASGPEADLFLAKLSAGGDHLWSRSAGDGAPQEGASVRVDAAGDILLSGGYAGTMSLFGASLPPAGATLHPFVARLDPAGEARWAVGSTGNVTGRAASVALDQTGHVLFAGDADGDLAMAGVSLMGGGGKDAFVGVLAY